MYFDFSSKSAILLIFFVHGILFTALLITKGLQSESKSNFWLAAFAFLCSMYIAPFMFGYAGWYAKQSYRDILFYVPFQQLFFLPPLLFFYVKSLLQPSFKFRRTDVIHFVPAILYLLFMIGVWVTDKLILKSYYFYEDQRDMDLDLWYQIVGFIMMIFYLIISLRLYNNYRTNTLQTVSYANSILFSWVQRFLAAFLLLLVIRIMFFILNPEWANFGGKFWYYLSFSILFYYISLSGYVNAIKLGLPFSDNFHLTNLVDGFHANNTKQNDNEHLADMTEGVSKEFDPALKKEIETLMTQEKTFTNPALTLFDLAQILNTHPKKVSEVVNQGFQMNFNDFINSHRVEEVIKRVHSKEFDLKTLVGIAYDSGFNSKSTFNRAFKKFTNRTPKEYFKEKV